MACRVKVRIKVSEKVIETTALVNSGFETDTPDIVIPLTIAEELGLWPPKSSVSAVLDTGGGEVITPYYENCGELELVLEDREPKRVRVNIVVNPYVDEVALSDYVSSELGIVLLDIKRGLWRLVDDPVDKVRESAKKIQE